MGFMGWFCQAAGGDLHWQDSVTFSSAKSPCQLHKDGRFSAHCQAIADPDFSNMRWRQWQQQLLGAASDSLDNLHRSWLMHPLRQSFLWASERCKPSLAVVSQLSKWPCLCWPLCLWWWCKPEGGRVVSDGPGCWFSEGLLLPRCSCPCLLWCLWWLWASEGSAVLLAVAEVTVLQKSSSSRLWNKFINPLVNMLIELSWTHEKITCRANICYFNKWIGIHLASISTKKSPILVSMSKIFIIGLKKQNY
jgi:hypothetical protein